MWRFAYFFQIGLGTGNFNHQLPPKANVAKDANVSKVWDGSRSSHSHDFPIAEGYFKLFKPNSRGWKIPESPLKAGWVSLSPGFRYPRITWIFLQRWMVVKTWVFFFFCDLKRTRGWSKRSRTQKSPEQVNVNVNITKQPFFCGWNFGCLLVTQTLTQIRSTYSVIFHWMMASRANWTIFPSHPKIGTSNQIQPS